MGKDNITFLMVIFPKYINRLKTKLDFITSFKTTEYLNYEKTKFSKSNEVGVFGNHVESTGIPSEVWRYYFLANLPKTSDTDFKGMASSLEIIMNYRKI